MSKIPIWLDCDTGHDDAFALLLSAYHPRANLLGVTTVHGNASLLNTTHNTRCILEAIGRRDIKVYSGSSRPLHRDPVHAAGIHGESGLDGVTLLPEPVAPAYTEPEFVDAMYNALIKTEKNTAFFVSTGSLTNTARLFNKYPELAEHVKGVSIMGGAVGGGFTDAPLGKVKGEGERFGNWTPFAEFNIYCDPEASSSILENPILSPKTTLITLDLSHKVLAKKAVLKDLLFSQPPQPTPSSLRVLFWQILTFFTETYAEIFALTEGPPLHDPLAVAAILEPEIFGTAGHGDSEFFNVKVVTEGVHDIDVSKVGELGRTKVEKLADGEKGVRIPRSVDVKKFWDLIEDCLKEADKATKMPALSREELAKHGVDVDGM